MLYQFLQILTIQVAFNLTFMQAEIVQEKRIWSQTGVSYFELLEIGVVHVV